MMTSTYTVVFDISQVGYKAFFIPAFGLLFVGIGILLFAVPNAIPFRGPPAFEKPFKYFFLGFSILWTLSAFASIYSGYHAATSARADNRAQVVEGLVHDFRPMPYQGHVDEQFCVSDACFAYSDYGVTPGFNNTASHGGPIREGLPVRVTYVGNTILRLEVAAAH
jgi:hypothetical protein